MTSPKTSQKIYLARNSLSPKTVNLINSIESITLDKSRSRSPMGGIALKHYSRYVKFNKKDIETKNTVEELMRSHRKLGSIFKNRDNTIKPEFRKKIFIPAIKIHERVAAQEELERFKAKREKRIKMKKGTYNTKKAYTGNVFVIRPFSYLQKLYN